MGEGACYASLDLISRTHIKVEGNTKLSLDLYMYIMVLMSLIIIPGTFTIKFGP